MAGTATRRLAHATIAEFEAQASQTVTLGRAVSFGATTDNVQNSAADADDVIGIARASIASGDTNRRVAVTLLGPVEVVEVGTGGATQGSKAIIVADGFTDAPAHDSDGTGNEAIYGIFMNDGAAGERVGMMLVAINRGS